MHREFLKDLGLEKDIIDKIMAEGLEKDTIDKIMAENGNDINSTKQKIESERDNYKEQLEAAQKTLKGFEGVDVNDLQSKIVNDLQSKITALQNDGKCCYAKSDV